MRAKITLTVRMIEQVVSVLALGLFALMLFGLRSFSMQPSGTGLALAIGAGSACLMIVATMIYLHYPPPRRMTSRWSESNSC